MQLLSNACIS